MVDRTLIAVILVYLLLVIVPWLLGPFESITGSQNLTSP